MKVVFATWMAADYQGRVLNSVPGSYRLLSYYFVGTETRERLAEYARKGVCKSGKAK